MPSRIFLRIGLGLALGVAAFGQHPGIGTAPRLPAEADRRPRPSAVSRALPAASGWIDNSTRASTQASYLNTFVPTKSVAMGWAGDLSTGNAGDTSQAYKDDVLARINWVRGLAGVPPISGFSATYNQGDQQAAMMMTVNGQPNHAPPNTWKFYSSAGATAAGNSNLCLGFPSADPGCIELYMYETASNNSAVGHRRWILYPQTVNMGTGDIPSQPNYSSSNALWVIDMPSYSNPRPATRDGFVAWPPKGFVPYELLPVRWSFSYPGGDFSAATVTATRGGSSVPVTLELLDQRFGENTIVWALDNQDPNAIITFPAPASDTIVHVTVNNVVVNGTGQSVSYDVVIFDPNTTPGCTYSLVSTSAAAAAAGGTGTAGVTTSPGCTWVGTSNASWLTITAGTPGTGTGTVSYTAAANATGAARSGTLTVAGLTFTVNQAANPALTVSSAHAGSFSQGQNGATYIVAVSDLSGAGPTSGTVTVTESLPAGMTLVSMAGTGWTCPAGGTTCTRSDVLNGGASYPPITVTVNVAPDAGTPLANVVSVSGGGSATSSATDTTVINVSTPLLSISKSHSGNFTQGQNGATYTVTVSNPLGARPTVGTVTVTEGIPAGLTLVSMAGTGWTCAAGGNTCTRGDVLNAGASYPPITVTVNVAASASSLVTNQVSVSGGGSPGANANDPTTVTAVCAYSVFPANIAAAPGGANVVAPVTTATGCGWTATSNATWITITSGSPGSGGGTYGFTAAANATGAQRSGTLTVAGQTVTVTQGANNPLQIPSLGSLNPFQGTGSNATLTLTYAHPSGWAAIRSAEFIVNPRWEANSRGGGCYVQYTPGTGLFTLIANDGTSVAGTVAPGTAGSAANSQCTLNGAGSSVTGSANTLTVVVSLTFSASFTGQRHIWMQAVDYNNLSTNWLVYGVWLPTQTTVSAGPWYRIYDPFSASYLYTFDANEYNTLGTRGFVLQGASGLVMDGPTTVGGVTNIAWYRVFVNATNSHLWTSDRNEFLTLINAQQAYVGEGVAAFVMPYINALGVVSPQVTNTIPFYRAAFQGRNLHFWTSDADEFFSRNGKQLPTGYVGEGIACYIFPTSGAQFTGSTPVSSSQEAAVDDGSPAVVSVTNGASYTASGVIAPGEAISIHGRHLGGTVLLNGAPAKAIIAGDSEIRVVAPDNLVDGAEVTLEVEHRGRRSRPVTLGVVAANPAIFGGNQYGRGNAQARNEDGTINDAAHPAARGSLVTIYGTGGGRLDLRVEAHIGGRPAEVVSLRNSVTRAGVIEVQVRVPEGIDAADFQPVVLHVGNLFSQPGIGLAIR